MEKKNYYTIAALAKAFGIIETMACKGQWKLKELADMSKLPKGTLQRILLTLCELGYVQQSREGGEYSLTMRFFRLGQRISENVGLVDKVHPLCRQLKESVNETVNFCMPSNHEMVILDQEASSQFLRLDSVIGSSFPIYGSASGKAYCAFLNERELMKVLKCVRDAQPSLTGEDIDRFCSELALVRREGVAFDYEEIYAGVRCVASPVFNYTGDVVASLGCSIPAVRITQESSIKVTQGIIRTAARISETLGAPHREFPTPTRSLLDKVSM